MFYRSRSFKGDWRYHDNNGHEYITSCLFFLFKRSVGGPEHKKTHIMSDDIIDFMLGGIFRVMGKILGAIASVIGKLFLLIFQGIWHGLTSLWNLIFKK